MNPYGFSRLSSVSFGSCGRFSSLGQYSYTIPMATIAPPTRIEALVGSLNEVEQRTGAALPGKVQVQQSCGSLRNFLRLGTLSGAGAWDGRAGDGAEGDLDGAADGHIDLDTAVLLPLSEHGPAMDRVQAGDLIVVVDGRTLEVATATVLAAGAQGGGR